MENKNVVPREEEVKVSKAEAVKSIFDAEAIGDVFGPTYSSDVYVDGE